MSTTTDSHSLTYLLHLEQCPTDDVIVITDLLNCEYKFLIDGVGWKILRTIVDGEKWKWPENQIIISHLIFLSKRFPEILEVSNERN